MVDQIDADVGEVAELFFADGEVSGKGALQLYAVLVHAMNAWPVIQNVVIGLEPDPNDWEKFRSLYREMKPFMDERPILVQLEAEDRVDAMACRALADHSMDRAA
jgi:hypothetical protein